MIHVVRHKDGVDMLTIVEYVIWVGFPSWCHELLECEEGTLRRSWKMGRWAMRCEGLMWDM